MAHIGARSSVLAETPWYQSCYEWNDLSESRLPEAKNHELSEISRKDWEGWKVNFNEKGAVGDVLLARMQMRDGNDAIITGQHMDVAVKQLTDKCGRAEPQFPQFMRKVFLQKNANHPCIVQTLGGYWPNPAEIEEDDDIEPLLFMERMTFNLSQVLDKQPLVSLDLKRRILSDVAAGIAQLHSRGIDHRDVNPGNVLMWAVDRQVVGRAKLSDFGFSRNAESTLTATMHLFTTPMGTSLYMPP